MSIKNANPELIDAVFLLWRTSLMMRSPCFERIREQPWLELLEDIDEYMSRPGGLGLVHNYQIDGDEE